MKTFIKNYEIKCFLFVLVLSVVSISSTTYSQEKNKQMNHKMNDSTLMQRQKMIHMRSHMVMPFNMSKVTHYFIKTSNGGILIIKAKDSKDTTQISLIRSHLTKEKELFSNADFRDPKTLHGMNMPGLKVLTKSKGKFKVNYTGLSDGAKLTFSSENAKVINALHVWFDAQMRDHGSDAKSSEK